MRNCPSCRNRGWLIMNDTEIQACDCGKFKYDTEAAEALEKHLGAIDELTQIFRNIRELQDSNDYPHVKEEMTRNMCAKAIALVKGE
jgi:hypothetical protein